MKLQTIDLAILIATAVFISSISAEKKSNDLDEISIKSREYAVHHHNYEEKKIPSTNEDLQTDESTVIKINRPMDSSQKISIRPKRGSKKFRHFVHIVPQGRKKRKLISSDNEMQKLPTKRPRANTQDQPEVKIIRTFEETHDYINENAANPKAAEPLQMSATESKRYEARAEQEFATNNNAEATEQHEHEHHIEHEKVKVKHHHHHHHHNHVKEKIVHVPVEKIVEKVVHVPKPYPVEKVVEKIIKVPVEKIVHVPKPYPVEKIIHVPIEKVVEKVVHVPKPYPVEKIVEKVVHVPIEKVIEKVIHVPKPYPVEKIVNKIVHVPKPYPVVKPVPFPVEVKVPFQVEKKVAYPVEKKIPVPYRVEVEKKIPVYIQSHEPYKYEQNQNENDNHQYHQYQYHRHEHEQQQHHEQQGDIEGHETAFEPRRERYQQSRDMTVFPSNQEVSSVPENSNQNSVNNQQSQIIYGNSPSALQPELLRQHLHNYGYGKDHISAPRDKENQSSKTSEESSRANSLLDLELAPSSMNSHYTDNSQAQARIQPVAQAFHLFQIQALPFQQPIVAV